jgi:hypothetical protein
MGKQSMLMATRFRVPLILLHISRRANISIGRKIMENKLWISKILEVLDEFSSQEFQERVWLNGQGPEVSSYEEAMCRLFDDLGFSEIIDVEWRQVGLSESAVIIMRIFRDKLLEFDNDVPEIPRPQDVLDRASWQNIRDAAFEAARSLRANTVG